VVVAAGMETAALLEQVV
jgi:hypothetical protein